MLNRPLFRRADDLDDFVDLSSVPRHRFIHNNAFIARLRKAVEFDYVMVSGLDIEGFHFGTAQSIDTDFPPAFLEAYYEEKFYLTDPFVIACKMAHRVVVESEAVSDAPRNERLAYLLETFNVRNRTVFPIRRGDLVYGSVGFTRSVPFDADEIAFLNAIAEATHHEITGPLMRKFAATELKLSQGEVACLRLASGGLTSEQIASESGYQVDTVNTYIKNATKKVGATNRTQAIAEAIRRGLID
ncbi:DNA-binding protein [Rhizobium sp. Root149]|uniref:LuxR family transcriptional regulator n=2 Tax=Rhizobium rhizoryzae TaxID=451876 RepID=A0A7W6LH37_9HYPH|nr:MULTISPECIES: LuxR family transcriptional regulator [Rhizobium]KQZ48532.1 DNA-binding protein [Rhizobium sp. Root149]MBB4144301.1 LuxR family transcriptional regulator [Rhizobium rhizoryzae]